MERKRAGPIKLLLIAAVTLLLGTYSIVQLLGAFGTFGLKPLIAVMSQNPVALSQSIEVHYAKQKASNLAPVEVFQRAQRVLQLNPLSQAGLRHFAVASRQANVKANASMLLGLSTEVSRRDLGTYIWLIDESAAQGDIRKTLKNYDIALRTSDGSKVRLFPILLQAAAEPSVATELATLMKANAPWVDGFLAYAIISRENPPVVAQLLARVGRFGGKGADEKYAAALIDSLAANQNFEDATRVVGLMPGTKLQSLVSVAVDKATLDPRLGALSWRAASTPGLAAQVAPESDARRSGLRVTAFFGERGQAFQKLLLLRPGKYQFFAEIEAQNTAKASDLWIEFVCATPGSKILGTGRLERNGNASRLIVDVVVGACPAQYLIINAAGGDAQDGATFHLRNLKLGIVQ